MLNSKAERRSQVYNKYLASPALSYHKDSQSPQLGTMRQNVCLYVVSLWRKGGFHERKGYIIGTSVSNLMIQHVTESFCVWHPVIVWIYFGPWVLHSTHLFVGRVAWWIRWCCLWCWWWCNFRIHCRSIKVAPGLAPFILVLVSACLCNDVVHLLGFKAKLKIKYWLPSLKI